MSRDGLAHDFNLAVAELRGEQTVHAVVPEHGALNDVRTVEDIITEASRSSQGLLGYHRIPRHTHTGLMDQNAPLMTQMVSDLVRVQSH